MKWLSNLVGYGLSGLGAVAIALSPVEISAHKGAVNAQTYDQIYIEQNITRPSPPKRHRITVTLTSPEDLKVKEGQWVNEGDVISDRSSERMRLMAKKKQLEIAVEQMSLPLSPIVRVPEPNYEPEMIALKKAKLDLKTVEEEIANFPKSKFFDPKLTEIHEPDRVKELNRLKEKELKATIAVEAALARLSAATTRYKQEQYQHALQVSRHQTNLQRQQYQLASLVSYLKDVEEDLSEIVAVYSPYSGRVRRVKIIGQKERLITAQITLDIRNRTK